MKKRFFLIAFFVLSLSACKNNDSSSRVYGYATSVITDHLVAPATAKFSDQLEHSSGCDLVSNNLWHSWGTVDSQNTYGGFIRGTWETYGNDKLIIYWRINDTDSGALSLRAAKELITPGSSPGLATIMQNVDDKIRLLKDGYNQLKIEWDFLKQFPGDDFAERAEKSLTKQVNLVEDVPNP